MSPLFNPPAAAGGASLSYVTGNLPSDFPLNVDTAYHDITGVSVTLTAGTWFVICTIAAHDSNGGGTGAVAYAKLLAGATVIGSAPLAAYAAGSATQDADGTITAVRVASGSETVKLQARTTDETDGWSIVAIADGLGGVAFATRLIAVQIA